MSKFGETLLGHLSLSPGAPEYLNDTYEDRHADIHVNVSDFRRTFPGIGRLVAGKHVLDIGCSEGIETFALCKLGAASAHGIDIRIPQDRHLRTVETYRNYDARFSVMDAASMSFPDATFDVAVTCGSFEHFNDPFAVLRECRRVVKPGGRILLTSGVWAHPWGAHMNFFTRVPWVQYLFSERTIMAVRKRFRSDGAERFHEVEGGLNKVGIRAFEQMVETLDLQADYLKLQPIKGLTALTRIPYVNELFTNLIIAVLRVGLSQTPPAMPSHDSST
jgi:ubiquinone/menaquinone biosynthesis C-methylase UbiE